MSTISGSVQYGILREAALQAAQIFIDSMNFSDLLDNKGFLHQPQTEIQLPPPENDALYEQSENAQFLSPRTSTSFNPKSPLSVNDEPMMSDELGCIEIKLRNGLKAYLLVPVPLPFGEKERIKKYIDLLLEEEAPYSKNDSDYLSSNE